MPPVIRPCPGRPARTHSRTRWRSEMRLKALLLVAFAFALQVLGLHRRRDYIFFAGPIAEIDNLAAFATKGKKRVAWGHFFFTDRALHRIARIGKAFAAAIGKAASE